MSTSAMKMGTSTIRPLAAEDRARWNILWQGYLDFYRQALAPEITEYTWNRLLDPAQPLHGLVASDAGTLVGFTHYVFHPSTWASTTYCYLEDLYVDAACRGKGTGRALIEAVYAAADAQGAQRVYWHTENTNVQAQRLYDSVAKLSAFIQYRRS